MILKRVHGLQTIMSRILSRQNWRKWGSKSNNHQNGGTGNDQLLGEGGNDELAVDKTQTLLTVGLELMILALRRLKLDVSPRIRIGSGAW